MLPCPRFALLSTLLLGFTLHAASSRAEVLDWNNITYSSATATPANKTALTPATATNRLSVQFALNNGATFSTLTTSPRSASNSDDTTYYTSGGGLTTQRSLQIVTDFANSTQFATITIYFDRPVANVSFNIFDVDSGTVQGGGYQDRISNIQGLGTNGTTVVSPTSLDHLVTGSTNTIDSVSQATANAQASAAQTSNAGNLTVAFNGPAITQFSFEYHDVFTTGTHSNVQLIGLSNITFTTVPEPGTVALLSLGVFGAATVAFRRRG